MEFEIIKKEHIFDNQNYFKACHASTILKCGDDRFVTAFFAGSKEGNDDVCIWVSVYDGGWSEPVRVSEDDGVPHWNPVLFSHRGGEITLYYKVGKKIEEWKTYLKVSYDMGKTWSEAKELVSGDVSGGRGPVKNKPILLSDGSVIAPMSTETDGWKSFCDIYKDGRWVKSRMPSEDNEDVIQPTFWEYPDGCVHALMRSKMNRIYRSDSSDFGATWSKIYPIDIPNNNCGIDCVGFGNGIVVLVANPTEGDPGSRTPLSLMVSVDNGDTFSKIMDLETDEGEYSYPAIINDGNRVYITYTYKRETIAFWEIEIDW